MSNVSVDAFEREVDCVYSGEKYLVRDNGAVLRKRRPGKRKRPLDEKWTFGNPCRHSGYMKLSAVVVHRILATAFYGEQPSEQHIVDHIDTNRRNNRAENLRWITRLDNILKNPITKRRIEISYGSLDAFFRDPSRPKRGALPKGYGWMRTVTKEEAEVSRKKLEMWSESASKSKGGQLGEWLFRDNPNAVPPVNEATKESLTPGAMQRNWRVATEFLLCPSGAHGDALILYKDRLVPGEIFSRNKLGSSEVVVAEFGDSGVLSVISRFRSNAVKEFAIANIVLEGGMFIHENGGSYFTLEGAVKAHCEVLNVPWKEHCESRGLPWGDSIDNYC